MPTVLDPTPTLPPGAARAADGSATADEYLIFRLGQHEYGIDNAQVLEIRGHEPTEPVARTPNFIKGVLKLRGAMIPIVDLRLKLEHEPARHDGFTVTIVLNISQRVVGVVVDFVSDLIALQPEHIQAAPDPDGGVHSDHVVGVGVIKNGGADRVIHLLDMAHLISGADIDLIEPALA